MAPVDAAGASGPIDVTLVHTTGPGQVETVTLKLPPGSTAQDALLASGWAARLAAGAVPALRLGLWGRLCDGLTVLQAGDRLALLRPLTVDPMEARRRRQQRDGLPRPARRTPRRA